MNKEQEVRKIWKEKKRLKWQNIKRKEWCQRGESNPYDHPGQGILSPLRLPDSVTLAQRSITLLLSSQSKKERTRRGDL
jgi:hypothetical protein